MPDHLSVTLSGDCTVRTIRTRYGEIAGALAANPALTLDCAEVERADIAFVQLVLAAAGTAERRGGRLILAGIPDIVRSAFARAGLAGHDLLAPAA